MGYKQEDFAQSLEERVRKKTNDVFIENLTEYEKEIHSEIVNTFLVGQEILPGKCSAEKALELYGSVLPGKMKQKYQSLYDRVFLDEVN